MNMPPADEADRRRFAAAAEAAAIVARGDPARMRVLLQAAVCGQGTSRLSLRGLARQNGLPESTLRGRVALLRSLARRLLAAESDEAASDGGSRDAQ